MSRAPGNIHAILVAFLAGTLVFARALPVQASSVGEGANPAAAETSILRTWLGYSATAGRDLTGFPVDEGKTARELSRLADRLRPAVAAAKGGPGVVDAFRRVLLKEEGFRYDAASGNTENFLAGGVVARKRGNCLGMSLLYLSLAEQLGVPFRGVYVPGHCFVRYEGEGGRRNVEFSDGGASWEDELYLRQVPSPRKGTVPALAFRPGDARGVPQERRGGVHREREAPGGADDLCGGRAHVPGAAGRPLQRGRVAAAAWAHWTRRSRSTARRCRWTRTWPWRGETWPRPTPPAATTTRGSASS